MSSDEIMIRLNLAGKVLLKPGLAEPTKCEQCGTDIPADAPLGLCPRCLAKAAILFAQPADSPSAKPDIAIERAGAMIGRYKLLQKIGEGGFGVVFMAEQIEPVQRKVTLKIIKPGMDNRQ